MGCRQRQVRAFHSAAAATPATLSGGLPGAPRTPPRRPYQRDAHYIPLQEPAKHPGPRGAVGQGVWWPGGRPVLTSQLHDSPDCPIAQRWGSQRWPAADRHCAVLRLGWHRAGLQTTNETFEIASSRPELPMAHMRLLPPRWAPPLCCRSAPATHAPPASSSFTRHRCPPLVPITSRP